MSVWAVIPLVSFLLFTSLAVLILRRRDKRLNRVFALFLTASGVWSLTSFMLHLNIYPQHALIWNDLLVAALLWTVASYYHFVRAYTNRPPGAATFVAYGGTVAVLVLALRGYFVQYAYVVNGVLFHELGNSLYLLGGLSAVLLFSSVLMLVKHYRNSIDPVDRNRTMYLLTGSVIVIGFTYATNMMPSVAGLPIDHIGNMINALVIAYAITRYQLLNTRFVMRKALAYIMLIACLGGIYAATFLLIQRFSPAQPISATVLQTTGLVVVLTLFARVLLRRIENFVYRVFHRRTYKYRRAMIEFSERMNNIINLDELGDEMLKMITSGLRLSKAKLFFQDLSGSEFTAKFTYPSGESGANDQIAFGTDNPLVAFLDKKGEPLNLEVIDTIPEFKGLWDIERKQIANSGLGLLFPIKSHDRLIGIIAVGKKNSVVPYSHEDLDLVMSMAKQAGSLIENAQLYSQAVNRANTDGLTSLYNHRHFHERLDQEIARGSRFGTSFSLIMLDVDLFKAYNDIHGHLAGDDVLRNIALYIKASVRGLDMAFRYGGEEFSVILPETRLDDAYKVAERLRKAIATHASSKAPPITISIGLASWPIDGVMKEEIISSADAALYRAKQTGRNRTCLSTDVAKPGTPMVSVELAAHSQALSIIYALAATVDAKDHYTYGHSKKVSDYAVLVGEAMGLSQEKMDIVRAAGLLHDIGKVGIPDSTLNKKGTLNDEEWELIRSHPKLGVEILRHVIDLVNCLPIILHHHERYDGSGYPNGLRGDNIPLEARILSVSDSFDAITSARSYREPLPTQQAIDEIKRCSGTQFDPKVVEIFCSLMTPATVKRLEKIN